MKLSRILMVSAIALFAMASCKNDGSKKSSIGLKNSVDSLSYCLGTSIGNSFKDAGFSEFNNEIFAKTVKEIMGGKESKIKMEEANMFIQQYFMKMQKVVGEKNLKEGRDFLEKNKTKAGIKITASGLQYEVVKEGTGPTPKADDEVSVQYKGSLIDGTVFESSYDRGQPASFPVNRVIPGWTELLQLMKVGSKYKAYIPTELAYGERPGQGKVKPNMALIFEVELLSINPKKAEAAAPQKPAFGPKKK